MDRLFDYLACTARYVCAWGSVIALLVVSAYGFYACSQGRTISWAVERLTRQSISLLRKLIVNVAPAFAGSCHGARLEI